MSIQSGHIRHAGARSERAEVMDSPSVSPFFTSLSGLFIFSSINAAFSLAIANKVFAVFNPLIGFELGFSTGKGGEHVGAQETLTSERLLLCTSAPKRLLTRNEEMGWVQ
ncbi:hypothetical protein AAE478_003858 [Parahypoxylon ruwenzoriense]